jgi:hypothetical protein
VGAKHRSLHVDVEHSHLMVAGLDVQLCEDDSVMELVEQFFDDGYWKFILHRLTVQRPVVDAEVPGFVLFFHEQH